MSSFKLSRFSSISIEVNDLYSNYLVISYNITAD
jgi:hypothetical protein